MRESKNILIFLCISALIASATYFSFMIFSDNLSFSKDTQDWGSFGSYFGGILAPIASFVAGYLIYQNLRFDAYHKRLEIVRESIKRLDEQTNSMLNLEFKNSSYGFNLLGRSFQEIVVAIDNEVIELDEDLEIAILAIFHNVAIMARSLDYYLSLLNNFESEKLHSEWLVNTEKHYWISKYSSISNRMLRVVGKEKITARLSPEEIRALAHIMPDTFS